MAQSSLASLQAHIRIQILCAVLTALNNPDFNFRNFGINIFMLNLHCNQSMPITVVVRYFGGKCLDKMELRFLIKDGNSHCHILKVEHRNSEAFCFF